MSNCQQGLSVKMLMVSDGLFYWNAVPTFSPRGWLRFRVMFVRGEAGQSVAIRDSGDGVGLGRVVDLARRIDQRGAASGDHGRRRQ